MTDSTEAEDAKLPASTTRVTHIWPAVDVAVPKIIMVKAADYLWIYTRAVITLCCFEILSSRAAFILPYKHRRWGKTQELYQYGYNLKTSSYPRPIPLFSFVIQIRWKFLVAFSLSKLQWSNSYGILHMTRQLCCRGMCKILQRNDSQQWNYIQTKFPSNLN